MINSQTVIIGSTCSTPTFYVIQLGMYKTGVLVADMFLVASYCVNFVFYHMSIDKLCM